MMKELNNNDKSQIMNQVIGLKRTVSPTMGFTE